MGGLFPRKTRCRGMKDFSGLKATASCQNNKMSLSLFPCYISKCHQIYNLVGKNRQAGSQEIKHANIFVKF